ncbi:glycosyltransferase family 4 protein [Aquimarina longa]|uniref:glycosyltransferase family 4 protein n=1 Tax=Aquimarina longa TaxID=1080221 RepID=UPI00078458CE|nr:glycosyltransferase family 4 protein [Aquimarina longa]
MKIVHIISSLNIGGAENFVVQLANAQSVSNDVMLIILGITDSKRNYMASVLPSIVVKSMGWTYKYSIRQFLQLNTLIGKIKPEVIHVHLHNPLYYVYGISLIRPQIKYIHTVHNSFTVWKKCFSYLNALRFINNRITHVCIAFRIYKDLRRAYPKLKSVKITNGIAHYIPKRSATEISAFWHGFSTTSDAKIQFLAIGNISKYKNFKLLALSYQSVYERYKNAMCVQIGRVIDSRLFAELKDINTPNLFFSGGQENAADFLAEADALIICSTNEGMPIVALEALSMGVPIISTPAGGMMSIIKDGYNGFITTDFEEASLYKAITKFIELPTVKKQELSDNARECFETNYEIMQIEKNYESCYQ